MFDIKQIIENVGDYQIRICKEEEYDKLILFIKNYWNENHIFVKSKKLLDFQYLDKKNAVYNFIVAYNTKTQKFDAIRGFIPLKQYDVNLDNGDCWGAIWKKIPGTMSGLGVLLDKFLITHYKVKTLAAINITQVNEYVQERLERKICELKHFYIKNLELNDFNIAVFSSLKQGVIKKNKSEYQLKQIDQNMLMEFDNFKNQRPIKSIDYIINRFLKHPVYNYELYGFYDNDYCKSVFVCRVLEANNSRCIRIVDWYGDFIKNTYFLFQDLLIKKKSEYIDLLCYMSDYNDIINMGFNLKAQDDIIPEYFEPFVQKNISIKAYYTGCDNYVMFKADGDQDRPSIIKG
ncbi:hypothetical protein O8I31_00640 [Campylobacter lari]|uniref:hypothetical protein n=1 Tax=Campylobacter lari TaxID=201 RepID=UPI00372943F0